MALGGLMHILHAMMLAIAAQACSSLHDNACAAHLRDDIIRSSSEIVSLGDSVSFLQLGARQNFVDPDLMDAQSLVQKVMRSHVEPNCTARMVVDAGLPRTGTASWTWWINSLGYTAIHHNSAVTKSSAEENYKHFFDSISEHFNFTAFADAPWAVNSCLIAGRRPHSMPGKALKFIAVRRNATAWLTSLKHMHCAYGIGMSKQACSLAPNDADRTLAYGHRLAEVNGEFRDVGTSYERVWNDFLHWLQWRWCERYSDQIQSFCDTEQDDAEMRMEAKVAKHFMHNYLHKLQQCIHQDSLLVVDLEDEAMSRKMADFLGCGGEAPAFGHTDSERHP